MLAAMGRSLGTDTSRDKDTGAIADGLVASAQPLLEPTNGSHQHVQKAFTIATLRINLALLPEESREKTLSKVQADLHMNDEEFDSRRDSIVIPMIERHQEMFPLMHMRRLAADLVQTAASPRAQLKMAVRARKYPVTDRYAPRPCNSGEKYKFCCGAKGR